MRYTNARTALAVALVGLASLWCRSAAPLAGGDPRPAPGTIAGQVAGPAGEGPARGYVVEAVRATDGALYTARTAATGRYSLSVPPGRYRVALVVVQGEEVIESPGDVEVEAGGLLADADFVVGAPGARGHVGG